MNSGFIKKSGIALIVGTIVLLFLSSKFGIPMNLRFFFGAFGIGSGAVLMVVANIVGLHHD